MALASDSAALPPVDWRAVDARVLAAAEQAARASTGGRGGARPVRSSVVLGAACAAAAGVLAVLLGRSGQRPSAERVERGAAISAPVRTDSGAAIAAGASIRAVADAPAEGVVLMLVAPVSYTAPDGVRGALAATTRLRQGGRICVGERGGRAVVAVHRGYRLDVRAGAEVTFARLSDAGATIGLSKGETRVDGPSGPSEPASGVSVEAGGWQLLAKGGAFVAKVEPDVIRVRVVDGKLGIVRGEGEGERELVAGDEAVLAKGGGQVRVLSRSARDAGGIDVAYLTREGTAFTLPELPERAEVQVAGHGALPAGLAAVRTSARLELRTRIGGQDLSLTLDPESVAPTGWRAAAVGAHLAGKPEVTDEPAAASPAGEPEPSPMADAAVRLAATVTPWSTARVHAPGTETVTDQARHALEQQLVGQLSACFAQCERSDSCGSYRSGWLAFDPEPDGTVSGPQALGFHAAQLERCIEQRSLLLVLPPEFARIRRRLQVEIERPDPMP
jgi:hypothetical protein